MPPYASPRSMVNGVGGMTGVGTVAVPLRITTVFAARSPIRCFREPPVQIITEPSRYGITNGKRSTIRRALRVRDRYRNAA